MTSCPRCGEPMTGGICNNCGFPLTKMRKRSAVDNQKSDSKLIRIALKKQRI